VKHCLIVLSAFCFFATHVQAMDITPRPCEAWNTARKANLSSVVQREWAFGYLSGLSEATQAQSGHNMYALLPSNEAIVSLLNQHCEQQPSSTVDTALRQLFNQLKPGQ
jgi:hypothetical protein